MIVVHSIDVCNRVNICFVLWGAIVLRQNAVLDREDPFVLINSLGQGVTSFDIHVTNTAPSATLTATATVGHIYMYIDLIRKYGHNITMSFSWVAMYVIMYSWYVTTSCSSMLIACYVVFMW